MDASLWKRTLLLISCLGIVCALVPGCAGDDPSEPDPDPDPAPYDGPLFVVRMLVASDSLSLHLSDPGWSCDDRWILFTAGPGSTIWKIRPSGDVLLPLTDPDITYWILGGHTPTGLADGRIAYFQGLVLGDFGMHVMAADSAQVAGEPPSEILHRFAGTAVGLDANHISSPTTFSLDASAYRAVATWATTWFLYWSSQGPDVTLFSRPATGLDDAVDFRIGHTGETVVYVDGDGTVHWMPFEAIETHPVGPGAHPSLAALDNLVGYVAPNSIDYVLVERETGRSTTYAGRPGLKILRPVLSWGGDRVAFLGEADGDLGLYLGWFVP